MCYFISAVTSAGELKEAYLGACAMRLPLFVSLGRAGGLFHMRESGTCVLPLGLPSPLRLAKTWLRRSSTSRPVSEPTVRRAAVVFVVGAGHDCALVHEKQLQLWMVFDPTTTIVGVVWWERSHLYNHFFLNRYVMKSQRKASGLTPEIKEMGMEVAAGEPRNKKTPATTLPTVDEDYLSECSGKPSQSESISSIILDDLDDPAKSTNSEVPTPCPFVLKAGAGSSASMKVADYPDRPITKNGVRKQRKLQKSSAAVELVEGRTEQGTAAKRILSNDSSVEQSQPKRPHRSTQQAGSSGVEQKVGDLRGPKKPRKAFAPIAPDLEVLIDFMDAEDGSISREQVEMIRFRISMLILDTNPEDLGPEFGFKFSGRSGAMMTVHCQSTRSRDWLMDRSSELNESFEGANLRLRTREDVPEPFNVGGWFPFPREVDESVLLGLLVRQNQKLQVNRWTIKFAAFTGGRDPSSPMSGAGYYIRFVIDEVSMDALKQNDFEVMFATTVVSLREKGKIEEVDVNGGEGTRDVGGPC